MENRRTLLASEIIRNQQEQITEIMQVVDVLLKTVSKDDLEKIKHDLLLKKRKAVVKLIISYIDKELEKREQEGVNNV